MRFSGALFQLKFDDKKYRKKLDEALQTQMRNAAREWLRAVYPLVPVWTGTARGTLLPLGRLLRVQVPIDPAVERKNRGPAIGASQSLFTFLYDQDNNVYTFDYEIFLRHYQENEFNSAPPEMKLIHPTPWHSFEAGETAFTAYLETILPSRIPQLQNYFDVQSLIVR